MVVLEPFMKQLLNNPADMLYSEDLPGQLQCSELLRCREAAEYFAPILPSSHLPGYICSNIGICIFLLLMSMQNTRSSDAFTSSQGTLAALDACASHAS